MYGGGYGSYGGGMHGASRYGMGGMGMGMGMGGMDQQYSWLHSIQHFTSSLGYLTEVGVFFVSFFSRSIIDGNAAGAVSPKNWGDM